MSQGVGELVIERPTAATIRDLARIVSGRRVQLESVRLVGDAPTLQEVLVTCADGDMRLIGDDDHEVASSDTESIGVPTELRISIGPAGDSHRTPAPPGSGSSTSPVANGGTLADPLEGEHLLPGEDHPTTADWVAETAERIGIDSDSLVEIATTVHEQERSAQLRRSLELAFEHHLERADKRGRGYVEIRTANSPGPGQYHYLDNGKGRGGAHYFRGLTPAMKTDIRQLSTAENLTVLAEGEAYISVSYEQFDVAADVGFVERVISDVFDGSLSDIVAVEEVIGREVTCSWIA